MGEAMHRHLHFVAGCVIANPYDPKARRAPRIENSDHIPELRSRSSPESRAPLKLMSRARALSRKRSPFVSTPQTVSATSIRMRGSSRRSMIRTSPIRWFVPCARKPIDLTCYRRSPNETSSCVCFVSFVSLVVIASHFAIGIAGVQAAVWRAAQWPGSFKCLDSQCQSLIPR